MDLRRWGTVRKGGEVEVKVSRNRVGSELRRRLRKEEGRKGKGRKGKEREEKGRKAIYNYNQLTFVPSRAFPFHYYGHLHQWHLWKSLHLWKMRLKSCKFSWALRLRDYHSMSFFRSVSSSYLLSQTTENSHSKSNENILLQKSFSLHDVQMCWCSGIALTQKNFFKICFAAMSICFRKWTFFNSLHLFEKLFYSTCDFSIIVNKY